MNLVFSNNTSAYVAATNSQYTHYHHTLFNPLHFIIPKLFLFPAFIGEINLNVSTSNFINITHPYLIFEGLV